MDFIFESEAQFVSTILKVKSVLYRLKRMSPLTDPELPSKLVSILVFFFFDYCPAGYNLCSIVDFKQRFAHKSLVLVQLRVACPRHTVLS